MSVHIKENRAPCGGPGSGGVRSMRVTTTTKDASNVLW